MLYPYTTDSRSGLIRANVCPACNYSCLEANTQVPQDARPVVVSCGHCTAVFEITPASKDEEQESAT